MARHALITANAVLGVLRLGNQLTGWQFAVPSRARRMNARGRNLVQRAGLIVGAVLRRPPPGGPALGVAACALGTMLAPSLQRAERFNDPAARQMAGGRRGRHRSWASRTPRSQRDEKARRRRSGPLHKTAGEQRLLDRWKRPVLPRHLVGSVNLIDLQRSAEPLRGLRATVGPRRIRRRTCGTR
jgi:hypothetical protein